MVANTMTGPNALNTLDEKELKKQLVIATKAENRNEAKEISAELEKRGESAKQKVETYEEKYQKIQEKIQKGIQVPENELKDFFSNDINQYRSSLQNSPEYKNDKIKDLEAQLNDVLRDKTSLKEVLSPTRMRLDTIRNKMEKLKDEEDYPKNVLIYAMSITKLKIFGTRQKIKRGFTTLARKWKAENMQENMANLEEKLEIDEDDNETRKVLKTMIAGYVHDAKVRYVEDVKKQVGI